MATIWIFFVHIKPSFYNTWIKPRPNDAIFQRYVCLATLLRHVECCWLKFENGQIFHETFVDVAWCCSRLARFVQQCCAWPCALARSSTRNMSQHVATRWPNACNMLRPTMLRSVAFKCWDRFARACTCWANNVGICCVEMLRSFGRGFKLIWCKRPVYNKRLPLSYQK